MHIGKITMHRGQPINPIRKRFETLVDGIACCNWLGRSHPLGLRPLARTTERKPNSPKPACLPSEAAVHYSTFISI
jgi:hypothetical protein